MYLGKLRTFVYVLTHYTKTDYSSLVTFLGENWKSDFTNVAVYLHQLTLIYIISI